MQPDEQQQTRSFAKMSAVRAMHGQRPGGPDHPLRAAIYEFVGGFVSGGNQGGHRSEAPDALFESANSSAPATAMCATIYRPESLSIDDSVKSKARVLLCLGGRDATIIGGVGRLIPTLRGVQNSGSPGTGRKNSATHRRFQGQRRSARIRSPRSAGSDNPRSARPTWSAPVSATCAAPMTTHGSRGDFRTVAAGSSICMRPIAGEARAGSARLPPIADGRRACWDISGTGARPTRTIWIITIRRARNPGTGCRAGQAALSADVGLAEGPVA